MAQRIMRDHEADGCERSDIPIISESSIGNDPYMRMTRGGRDNESSYGRNQANDIISMLTRTTPFYKIRNRPHICSFYNRGICTRGAECPYRHEMLGTGESHDNTKDRYYDVSDLVAMRLLGQAREIDTLESSEDGLKLGELNSARIQQLDIRDQFYKIMNVISSSCCWFSGSCL